MKRYNILQLTMNNEQPVSNAEGRHSTLVDEKHIESIKTPEGRELTSEELFDFVLGSNITDLSRSKSSKDVEADVAIVLGNEKFDETRQRAIKAFELYKRGLVKKIIFTGGVNRTRDTKSIMHPKSKEEYMSAEIAPEKWEELPEADWGAETFIPSMFEEDYKAHSKLLSAKFLRSIGVKPEDVITEPLSESTKENAEFCKNVFDTEEIETGMKIKTAIIVTTCTHMNRAMKQFQKVFGDSVHFKGCISTLDFERFERLKAILNNPDFDEEKFKKELKRIYCTVPELKKKLMEETANHRNAYLIGSTNDAGTIIIDKGKDDREDIEH